MEMRIFYQAAVVLFFLAVLVVGNADAGTVNIVNKFSKDVGVAISAGTSESQVTVYAGESRNYTTFANKAIEKIAVVNLSDGSQLGVYTAGAPSAAANFTVSIDTNGYVAVTTSVLP